MYSFVFLTVRQRVQLARAANAEDDQGAIPRVDEVAMRRELKKRGLEVMDSNRAGTDVDGSSGSGGNNRGKARSGDESFTKIKDGGEEGDEPTLRSRVSNEMEVNNNGDLLVFSLLTGKIDDNSQYYLGD